MPSNRDLAKIHIAKKELGLDDETYRDLLAWKFKVSSARDLKPRQVVVLLNHFKAHGWRPRYKRPDRRQANDPQARKIRALWIKLGKSGVLRNSSERALAAYVKRLTKVDDLHFATVGQKSIIIESLKKWLQRTED